MSEDQIKRFIINLEDDGSVKEWKAEYTDPRGNAGDPNYEITPKVAEFSEVENGLIKAFWTKPASSSEFDAGGAEKFVDLEFGDQQGLSYENVVTAMRWQHARDAEEIRGFRDEKDDAWDAYKHLLGSAKDKTNQLYFAQEKIQKLTEENQRLREQLTHYHQFHESGKCQRMIDDLVVERKKLTAALFQILNTCDRSGLRDQHVEVLYCRNVAHEALAADSGGAE